MSSSLFPVVIAVTLFAFFGYGCYDFLAGFDKNECEMTFMYEYPQFVRITMPPNVTQRYPRYKLYVYGEGVYTEQLRDGKFNGIPVLFIPGNGGSYKQARSVASVAYRRAVDSRLRQQLNVFTADLGEDLAAVHGGLLTDQTHFVAECVRAVLRLYRAGAGGPAPTSVAVIGHSMGGVVAHGLYVLPGFDPSSVRHLYLLAAPIGEPPLRIDRAMAEYYAAVDAFWRARRATTLRDVTVLSVSGGERDVQVRPHLTAHPTSDVTTVTTAVHGVWTSTDHQCIVWCRQLVLVLVRALYDLVDVDTRQLTADPDMARRVLRHHFVQRTHGKHFRNAFYPATVPMDPKGEWKQYGLRQWTFTAGEVGRPTYLMIGLMTNPLYQRASLRTVNLSTRDWLVACVASRVEKGVRMCAEGINLSGLGEQAPSSLGHHKTVNLDMQQLTQRGYTHVVVVVRPTDEKVTVHCDVSRRSDRNITTEAPAFTSFRAFFQSRQLLDRTEAGALTYNVSLHGLTDPWQAVQVHLKPAPSCGLNSQAALAFHVPWAQETRTVLLSGREGSITAKLQQPRPVDLPVQHVPYVTAHLDPDCTYTISLQSSFPELWGQMARFFGPLLLPTSLAVVMVTLSEQLRAADAGQQLTTHSALAQLTPLKLVMPTQLLTSLLGWSALARWVPVPDLPSLAARGITCSMLPFLMYFVSWTVVALLSLVAWGVVGLVGGLVHRATSGLVSRSVGGSEAVTELAVTGLSRFPVLMSVGLSALAISSCGEIALGLGLLVCCVKVFQSHEEVLRGGGPRATFKAYTSVTLTLLWLWATVIHLPCLLVWSKTRSEGSQLAGDSSLVTALVLCNSGAVLWRDGALRHDLAGYKVLASVVTASAIGVYLFAMVNVYRASWLASAVVMATALHQLVAPVAVPQEPDADGEEEEEEAADADDTEPTGDALEAAGEASESADDRDSQLVSAEDGPAAGDGVRQRAAACAGGDSH